MTHIVIAEVGLTSLGAVSRLFVHAVRSNFAYFPLSYQDQVIRDHTAWRLARARLDPRRVVLTARQDGQLLGYAIGSAPRGGAGQIYWLYVDPASRGQNTGLKLLSRMLKVLHSKGAGEVALATHDHRRYYERQGFSFVERRLVAGVSMDIMRFSWERS